LSDDRKNGGLPDRPRPGLKLPRPPAGLAGVAARAALATAYRVARPESPEPFVRAPHKAALSRHYYESEDGWQAALFCLPPLPGAAGEPVVLAHGLGVNRHSLDWAGDLSLARALQQAGFSVFLMEHRGDRSAVAPEDARPFDFDDIAAQDVPAALDQVRERTGYPRVHWVGHALGGQLLYAHLAHERGDGVAACVSMCAPVRFPVDPSRRRAAAVARQLLPSSARLPLRAAAAVMAPGVHPGERLAGPESSGPVARGVLVHGVEDVSGAMMRQALQWLKSGTLCDRHDRVDYLEAIAGLPTPLLLVSARGDALCPPEAAAPALDVLAGPQAALTLDRGWGHMDPLLGRRAPERVFPEVVSWLHTHRRLAWED
jgi:predicted alpha/beta hydrolase